MKVATGTSILRGIAIGRLKLHRKEAVETSRTSSLAPEEEYARFQAAQKAAQEQLGQLYEKALDEVGEDNAAIFEIHQMMLEDEDYVDAVKGILDSQGATAEYAVTATGENFAAAFAAMEDPYMQARSADVKDISRRVVNILTGTGAGAVQGDEPAILMADDLTPSETVQMDKSKLLGFITRGGSANSHTAILARTMGIPALVGVDFDESWDGQLAILDGCNHCVYVDPAPELLAAMEAKRRADLEQEALLQGLKKKPNVTLDGTEIQVYANIGGVGDVGLVLQNDAQGIGLFRSEFLYLDGDDYPAEEEQFAAYKRVVETMAGKKVIIRTLDVGADKLADYFGLDHEENPALGYRAIRICLTRRDVFKDPAPGHPPGQRLRHSVHHVPHDYLRAGGAGRQRDPGGVPRRAEGPGRPYGGGGDRRDDRDPRLCDDRRRAGPGGAVLLPGHQRPDPVHFGHRPAEPQAGRLLQPPPPGHPADDPAYH